MPRRRRDDPAFVVDQSLQAYAESKTWAQRPRPFTEVRQRVPCLVSPSGRHGVTMTFAKDGTLVGITSDCEQHQAGAAYAAGRLSKQTCGYPLRLARDFVTGHLEAPHEDDENEDDEDARDPNRERIELLLVDALGSLPGCGGRLR